MPTPRLLRSRLATLWLAGAAAWLVPLMPVAAAPKTVCTITINSPDEREVFQHHLPADQYRFVELVRRGKPDWLAQACKAQVSCDALVISGHFDDGSDFYTDRIDQQEHLPTTELESAACSSGCSGLFAQLKEVYLFGCNTLKTEARQAATGEILRSLARAGHAPGDVDRLAALLNQRYGQSNRERLRHVFQNVPVLYGFWSKAPLGRTAGPLLERYFQTAPAGEVASGRPSATLLNLFGPTSMTAVAGLSSSDPQASFRQDVCALADPAPGDADKVAFMHQVLQRDMPDVRLFLDHLERYALALNPARRLVPAVAARLGAIQADHATRDRYLVFARDVDDAGAQTRMMALARTLGWLSPAQEQAEFLRMVAGRMARGPLLPSEVDLVCSQQAASDPPLAPQLLALRQPQAGDISHAAALACLGSVAAHEQTVQALTGSREADIEMAQLYLRHRRLADVGEVRAVATSIGRMAAVAAQVRALETLARQRLADPDSLQAIAGLFPRARSLDVQRAIAGILLRADLRQLSRADLARSLRQYRLKSRDGNDVIDVLIRVLQQA